MRRIFLGSSGLFFCLILLFSASSFAATISYPQVFAAGWNLAGNSLATPITVKGTFGTQTNIVSLWKWDAANAKWAFYSPSLDTAGTLAGTLRPEVTAYCLRSIPVKATGSTRRPRLQWLKPAGQPIHWLHPISIWDGIWSQRGNR